MTPPAGPGHRDFAREAREAAMALEQTFVPVDYAILAIVDGVNIT